MNGTGARDRTDAVDGGGATGGGRPAQRWHGRTTEEWRRAWGLPALRIYDRVASTNDAARDLAEQGHPHGTVVLTDHQYRGRGRRGRQWTASPGKALALSVILRPGSDHADGAALPLRVGLAAARAVEEVAGGLGPAVEGPGTAEVPGAAEGPGAAKGAGGAEGPGAAEGPGGLTDEVAGLVGLKWPNDLVLRGRKLGGVLCEGATEGGRQAWVVAGVGINVLQQGDDWPPGLAATATSLAESGAPVELPALAGALARAIAQAGAGGRLDPTELRELRTRDVLRGRAVTVEGGAGEGGAGEGGVAAGIDHDGALLVERDGALHRILSGTVRATETRATERPG